MTFTAISIWQGDFDWEVEVRVHGFTTPKGAANFASGVGPQSADKLRLKEGELVFLTPEAREWPIPAEDITVARLKPGSYGKIVFGPEDFMPVAIHPKDFHLEPGLSRGFASLAYGVEDTDGNPVTAAADPLETAPLIGDITNLAALLGALRDDGTRLVQASGLVLEDRGWVIEGTGKVVDEGIAVLAVRQKAIQRCPSGHQAFTITDTGKRILASLERGQDALSHLA